MSALTPEELVRIPVAEYDRLLAKRRHRSDPGAFVRERLREYVWSKQVAILESVRDHRRTAVPSCHGVGKSRIASRAAAWWLETHPIGSAFVLTTAPTTPQVKAVLWRYIRLMHANAGLSGRVNQTEWYGDVLTETGDATVEQLLAFGRKPADMNPSAFQGIHARYVLVILDEACGIVDGIYNAATGIASNDDSRILAIGNPDDPTSRFERICRPNSGWNVVPISAFDSPNFTGEPCPPDVAAELVGPAYVEDAKRDWGEESPEYKSKVLGEFPESREDALIPLKWIRAAQARWRESGGWEAAVALERARLADIEAARSLRRKGDSAVLVPDPIEHELGNDVGGGHDKSTTYERLGDWARLHREHSSPDTMVTTGYIAQALDDTGATCARVDVIGIGHGVVDRGKELGKPFIGVNVASAPDPQFSNRFANLRAQYYWGLRQRFQDGAIVLDPADEVLAAQLSSMRYFVNSSGKTQIESKAEMKKRGLPSPDRADALMLAYAPVKPSYHAMGMPIAVPRANPWVLR